MKVTEEFQSSKVPEGVTIPAQFTETTEDRLTFKIDTGMDVKKLG